MPEDRSKIDKLPSDKTDVERQQDPYVEAIEQGLENDLVYGAVDDDINANSFDIDSADYREGLEDQTIDDVSRSALEGTATDAESGGATYAGETQDLTIANLGSGRRMGGATGGDVYGAGGGSGEGDPTELPDRAQGEDKPLFEDPGTGLASKVAAENTFEIYKDELGAD
jgi:hypothetical protein